MQDIDDMQEQRVDWLVGAALLVRGETIERVGLLDERFFMYSEELEWQHRLQMQDSGHLPPSRRIAYLPQAVVMHYEGRSSEQLPVGRHLYFQRSKLALARLWYGTLFAETLRWFLLVWYAWEWLVEAAKFLVGHRRELRRQRIDVYTTILRNGLH
jgi:GT2 family glycosyltransferase